VATSYLLGVSTRRVEKLVEQLGVASLSKAQVSEMATYLDAQVEAFRNRPVDAGPYTFVWLDALTVKVREAGHTVNVHALIAHLNVEVAPVRRGDEQCQLEAAGSGRPEIAANCRAATARPGQPVWPAAVRLSRRGPDRHLPAGHRRAPVHRSRAGRRSSRFPVAGVVVVATRG
jgi:hypothetical protein